MTTEPTTYRKKPVEIQAMRWDGTNAAELEQWTGGNFRTDPRLGRPEAEIWDELHASWINVLRDQWVIRGVKGEFYPCAEDVFEQTYDEVPADAPSRPVAAVPTPVQGADPTGPREASWDEPPADATARRQWEEDVLKKAVAPTGPQEAPWMDLREAIEAALAGHYDAWPDTAVTSPHEAAAYVVETLLHERGIVTEPRSARQCACPGCPVQIVGGDSAMCDRCRNGDGKHWKHAAWLEADANRDVKAPDNIIEIYDEGRTEGGGETEAEAHEIGLCGVWGDGYGAAEMRHRNELAAGRDRADKAEALLRAFVAERDEYIVAIKNCPPSNSDDYWRWQGHAAARRQLGERLTKLRAGTEEARSNG